MSPYPFIYLLSVSSAASSCRGKMRVIIGVPPPVPLLPSHYLPFTTTNTVADTLNRRKFTFAQAQVGTSTSRVMMSIGSICKPRDRDSYLRRSLKLAPNEEVFLWIVNVKNLLDVPPAEVLGLESRGQTGCSWVRRPPRQHLTRLIEEHTV